MDLDSKVIADDNILLEFYADQFSYVSDVERTETETWTLT
jgi:hypothetical protein